MHDFSAIALEYWSEGWNAIPVNLKKRPLVKWRQWKSRRQTKEEVVQLPWQNAAGVAGITGLGHVAVDVDIENVEKAKGLVGMLPVTRKHLTPSRGYHLLYASKSLCRSIDRFRSVFGIEVQGVGNYIILPGSFDGRYQVTNPEVPIAVVDDFEELVNGYARKLGWQEPERKRRVSVLPTPPANLEPSRLIATLGVTWVQPTFCFDVDLNEGLGIDDLLQFIKDNALTDWDIYMTQHGCYVVDREPGMTWDQVQFLLDSTKAGPLSKAGYIRNCRELRIRVGPKFSSERKVSGPPRLVVCNCPGGSAKHHDKRYEHSRIEGYWTSSR
ncbi:MAG: bifunctional DNA primase/polymerase [Thaumarchaeota archaeon]|nr:bifunctional DNA primase/polymerase [Nitrososphaerota archaeon]